MESRFTTSMRRAMSANSFSMAAEMMAAGVAEELGIAWHILPPTDRAFIEIVEPAQVQPPSDTPVFGEDPRHAWRLQVTTFNFGGHNAKQAGDQFLLLIRQHLVYKSPSPFDGERVLVLCWRVQPEVTNETGTYKAYRARLILEFMPRSFLAEEPNGGVRLGRSTLSHITRDWGKSEAAKIYRDFYREAFAKQAAHGIVVTRQEFEDGLTAESLDKEYHYIRDVLRAREVLDKAGAPPITQEEVEAVMHTPLKQHYAISPARSGPNDVNVFRVADHLVDASAWFYKREPVEAHPDKVNAFDAMKLAARQARIARNEAAPKPIPVSLPDITKMIETTRREHNLCRAIDRTELPHEATIHDRLMPYRHQED